MDLNAALSLSHLLPGSLPKLYQQLWQLHGLAKTQGFDHLSVTAVQLAEGYCGTTTLGISPGAIRNLLRVLDALQLIDRSLGHDSRDGQAIRVRHLDPDHLYELTVALRRMRDARVAPRIVKMLYATYPSGLAWEVISQHLRGKTWAADLLVAPHRRPENLLPGIAQWRSEQGISRDCPAIGWQLPSNRHAIAQQSGDDCYRLNAAADFPKGTDSRRGVSAAAATGTDEDDPMRNSTFRTQEEKDAAREATRKRKADLQAAALGNADQLPVPDGKDEKGRVKTTLIPNGLHKEERRKQKKSVEPFCVHTWSPWDKVKPILEELFGEGCISLTEEEKNDKGLVITRAGVVIPAESDSRAWGAMGICYYGYKRPGVRWSKPGPDLPFILLMAWKLWMHVAGKDPSADLGLNIETLAGRIGTGRRNSIPEDHVLPALAGLCFRHIEACERGHPEWGPNTFDWNEIFSSKQVNTSITHWGKAKRMKKVGDAIDYLEGLPRNLPLHDFEVRAPASKPATTQRKTNVPTIRP